MLELTSAELKDDLGVVSFGDRRRLMLGVTILKAKHITQASVAAWSLDEVQTWLKTMELSATTHAAFKEVRARTNTPSPQLTPPRLRSPPLASAHPPSPPLTSPPLLSHRTISEETCCLS